MAPSFNSPFLSVVLTADFLDLNALGNASSAVVVTTSKLVKFFFGYEAWHWLHSIRSPWTVLGLSSRLPHSKQNIREPTTDISMCVCLCSNRSNINRYFFHCVVLGFDIFEPFNTWLPSTPPPPPPPTAVVI